MSAAPGSTAVSPAGGAADSTAGAQRGAERGAAPAAPVGRARLLELSVRTNAAGSIRALSHFGAVIVVGVAICHVRQVAGLAGAAPLIVLQAYLVAFLFNPVHECAHKTAFRSRMLNTWVGHAAAGAVALPYEYYSLFHWDHHRYTQDPERDPELVTARAIPDSAPRLALWFSGVVQLTLRLRLLLRHALRGRVTARWIPEAKRGAIVTEARCYVAVYLLLLVGSIALHTTALIWVWLLPLFVGQVLLRPYLLAEHTGCARTRSAFENTRTTYTHAVVRWFAWNMPYHVEHHAYPSVPFHALQDLNALVAPHAKHQGQGYRAVVAQCWRWFRTAERR